MNCRVSFSPDKNYGDYEATQKFQEVSAAWEIVQRHYDNPASSHQPEGFSSGRGDDEDGFEDEEEMAFFFQCVPFFAPEEPSIAVASG